MESNHIGASFYLHAIFFQVYHSCTRCAKYTADKQSCQPPRPPWYARRYFGNFQSILIREFFFLYWFPFCAPPSSDCTLPNFGFITPCRISQGRRTRTATNRTKICCATITPYLVGRGCYPPMLALLGGTLLEAFLRYFHVLWAGLEPARTYKAFCIATLTLYAIIEFKDASTNSATKASVGTLPHVLSY